MRSISHIFLLTIIIWAFPYKIICGQADEFPYKVLIGVTGSEKQIKVKGDWINIEFSDLSQQGGGKSSSRFTMASSEQKFRRKDICLWEQQTSAYHVDIDGQTKVYSFVSNWLVYQLSF